MICVIRKECVRKGAIRLAVSQRGCQYRNVQTVVYITKEDVAMVYKETVLITGKVTMTFLMDFVKSANEFSSYIIVEVEGRRLNAKSILSMGRLTTHFGPMKIIANGLDGEEALYHLKKRCEVVQKKSV